MSFLQIIKVYLSGKFHSLNSFSYSQRITNQGCVWDLAMNWHCNWEKQLWILSYSNMNSLKRVMVSFLCIITHSWSLLLSGKISPHFPFNTCHCTDLTFLLSHPYWLPTGWVLRIDLMSLAGSFSWLEDCSYKWRMRIWSLVRVHTQFNQWMHK